MRYKLIENSLNDIQDIQTTVMNNRGIQDIYKFTHISNKNEYSYEMLSNIQEAISILNEAINKNWNIHIIVDCDVDGYTSAAIVYQYIEKLDYNGKLTYSIHTQKQHGLSDDIIIPEETNLLIIPDAGTNDIEQCKKLSDQGIKILI